MHWGTVEQSPEVEQWVSALSSAEQARVFVKISYLATRGPLLGEPHTRQLVGKLRELRIALDARQVRITYFIASGRRIVLLTVFRKQRARELQEIRRAQAAMRNWQERDSGGPS